MAADESKDFFISYNKADRSWAEWIAWQLEAEGYSAILQAWDFRPGNNFVLQINKAVTQTKRTMVVLSPNYLDLKAGYSHAEWAASLVKDPDGQKGILLPIRVRECQPLGLLAALTYIDLVDLDAIAARNALLAGIRLSRALPSVEPLFPGKVPSPLPTAPSFPGEWPEVWQVPYPRNPFFTGREELLAQLHESLFSSKTMALTQKWAISGLGGIGKTQTAIEYAYRYQHEYEFVFWVNAEAEETFLAGFLYLAKILRFPEYEGQEQRMIAGTVVRWLNQHQNWLLILDNADDIAMIGEYLPGDYKANGHLLITTRAKYVGVFAQSVDIEVMDQEEGSLLLLRRAKLLARGASLEQANEQDRSQAQALVNALDGLPLAIDQAGAYIEETKSSLSTYLTLYQGQERRKYLLGKRGSLPPGHTDSVEATLSLSFRQVERINLIAANLLRLCAFLAPDAIPEELFTQKASSPYSKLFGEISLEAYQLDEAIGVLLRFSLIRRSPDEQMLSIHRLVQVVVQNSMDRYAHKQWTRRAVRAIARVLPDESAVEWARSQRYLLQALICVESTSLLSLILPAEWILLNKIADYLRAQAEYAQAELLYQHCIAVENKWEWFWGNSRHLNTCYNLALLYREQGHYEKSKQFYGGTVCLRFITTWPEILSNFQQGKSQVVMNLAQQLGSELQPGSHLQRLPSPPTPQAFLEA